MPTLSRPVAFASLGALCLAALLTIGPSPRALAEDAPSGSDDATLVVKLPRSAVRELEALVARHGGVVFDTATLGVPKPATLPSSVEGTSTLAPAAAPTLRRAADMLAAVEEVLQQVITAGGERAHLKLTAVDINARRARLTIAAAEPHVLDAVRDALHGNAYLAERGGERFLSAGSVKRQRDGSFKAEFTLRSDRAPMTPGGRTAQASAAPDLLHTGRIQRAAAAVGMTLIAAGEERFDKNRRLGTGTIYRDFTFAAAPRDRIVRLLRALAEGPGVLTQIRYKLVMDLEEGTTSPQRATSRLVVRVAAIRLLETAQPR